jgi:protein TonB
MKGYFLPSSSDARALHIINEEFVGGSGSRSYMYTTMFSVMVHGALFITLADPLLDLSGITDREPTDRSINISLQRPAPPEVVQQPEPKPRVTATPEPQTKPEPKPKVEPAPPRPEVTESAEVGEALMASDARKQEFQSYLSQILAKIERNKHYPRMARRRGTEGAIQVNFTVLGDGNIRTLQLHGGHKLLSTAARNAINKSIPLPSPPRSPYQVAFTMKFELN